MLFHLSTDVKRTLCGLMVTPEIEWSSPGSASVSLYFHPNVRAREWACCVTCAQRLALEKRSNGPR